MAAKAVVVSFLKLSDLLESSFVSQDSKGVELQVVGFRAERRTNTGGWIEAHRARMTSVTQGAAGRSTKELPNETKIYA